MGFKLISATNNDCAGKAEDMNEQYLNYFEVVFYKSWVDSMLAMFYCDAHDLFKVNVFIWYNKELLMELILQKTLVNLVL